jgi:hypothetical protein
MSEEVNFEELKLPITDHLKTYPLNEQREIFEYLNEMDEINRKAYLIAHDHLKTSFNIARSNGFKEWKQSKTKSK